MIDNSKVLVQNKTLKPYIDESKKIDSAFSTQWDLQTRLLNLMEEVGEFSHDVLVRSGKKSDDLHSKNVGLDLSNLLFEVFLLADLCDVDLDKSWEEYVSLMPAWVEKRNK